jgi:hypothetical protein
MTKKGTLQNQKVLIFASWGFFPETQKHTVPEEIPIQFY